MNVYLNRELEQLVRSRVDSGRYGPAGEVIADALRLLAERDEAMERRKQDLHRMIATGLESLSQGTCIDGEEFFAQLEIEERFLAEAQDCGLSLDADVQECLARSAQKQHPPTLSADDLNRKLDEAADLVPSGSPLSDFAMRFCDEQGKHLYP